MTQLILDANGAAVQLPESKKGGYTAQESELSVDVEMVSGRTVREVRGAVWVLTYQYGYFDTEQKDKVLAACQKGARETIHCGFLPQESNDGALSYSDFIVTSFTRPKFMWARKVTENGEEMDAPVWADFKVELREVRPHD